MVTAPRTDPAESEGGPAAGAPQAGSSLGLLLRRQIDAALTAAEAAVAGRPLVVLDAGCGERTVFRAVRGRIARIIGVDVHRPTGPNLDVDEFLVADLCAGPLPIPEGTIDVAASVFTLEHFADPGAALRAIGRCLAPHGRLVLVTVNRRHPFVAAYFALPGPLRRLLQGLVKARAAEAHELVGACNEPASIRAALVAAGFRVETLDTVGHLATAWGRRRATRLLGRLGDGLTAGVPSRRSTIVVLARRATAPGENRGQRIQSAASHPDGGGM